jgi:hypothetical protein
MPPSVADSFVPVLAEHPWCKWVGNILPEHVSLGSHTTLHIGCERCTHTWRPIANNWKLSGFQCKWCDAGSHGNAPLCPKELGHEWCLQRSYQATLSDPRCGIEDVHGVPHPAEVWASSRSQRCVQCKFCKHQKTSAPSTLRQSIASAGRCRHCADNNLRGYGGATALVHLVRRRACAKREPWERDCATPRL